MYCHANPALASFTKNLAGKHSWVLESEAIEKILKCQVSQVLPNAEITHGVTSCLHLFWMVAYVFICFPCFPELSRIVYLLSSRSCQGQDRQDQQTGEETSCKAERIQFRTVDGSGMERVD